MSKHPISRTSVSALIGAPVTDAAGKTLGRVCELGVDPSQDANHIAAIVYKCHDEQKSQGQRLAHWNDIQAMGNGSGFRLREDAKPNEFTGKEHYLLLERDLLDQQIIDVHGRKVVRVNDIELQYEQPGDETAAVANADAMPLLRISEVETGVRGAVRRLLKGLPKSTVEIAAMRFPPRGIPWEFVDLIEADPARRVRLKIESSRLASMHPSDIADILEDLSPAEREAVFTSLNEEVAAETLEEVDPKLQKALIESLDSERIAGIVEEMDPAAAADLLGELTDEKSEAILEEMDPEERQDVEELLEFPEKSAAGVMTTDYVSVPLEATVQDAIESLRSFEGDTETITEIYLLDQEQVLKGIVPLSKIVLAAGETKLATLADPHFRSCQVDAGPEEVIELFDKYNLRALAIVDKEKKLAGVVHAEQVIALLRAER